MVRRLRRISTRVVTFLSSSGIDEGGNTYYMSFSIRGIYPFVRSILESRWGVMLEALEGTIYVALYGDIYVIYFVVPV